MPKWTNDSFLPSFSFILGGGVFDRKSWKKTGAVASIFLIPGGETSTEYEPCWPGKGRLLFFQDIFHVGHPAHA
jgi:hypothetical protein